MDAESQIVDLCKNKFTGVLIHLSNLFHLGFDVQLFVFIAYLVLHVLLTCIYHSKIVLLAAILIFIIVTVKIFKEHNVDLQPFKVISIRFVAQNLNT